MEENKKDEEVKKTSEETSQVEKTDEVKEENKPDVTEEPNQEEVEKEAKEQPKVEAKQDVKPEEKSKEKNTPTKKKKSVKIIVFLVIAIFIIVAIIVYFKVFHRKTIDLTDYIEVTYYTSSSSSSSSYYYNDTENPAYNGYATIVVSLDTDKLEELLGTEKRAERFVEKTTLTVESEDNGSLSNGDVVEVSVDISDSYLKDVKLKLKDETLSITVEGLEEADVLDLFGEDDFEVELTGISPQISMTVNNNSTDDFIKRNVTYTLDKSSGLANGDVVTITASYDNSVALSEGIVIATDTYEYTVEGMPEYVDSLETLSTDILDSLKAKFVENVKTAIEDQGIYVIAYNYDDVETSAEYTTSEPELVASYLLTKKGTSSSWYSDNRISAIYRVVYTITSTGATYDWYYVATATDVATQDGSIYEADDISYSVSGRWDDGETQEEAYDDLIDSYKNNYVIETIE